MKSFDHQLAGTGLALLVYSCGFGAEAAAGVFVASTAPDWMEVPSWSNGIRRSLIPHRTITHWFLLWVIALSISVVQPISPAMQFIHGFCLGGILHVLMDSTTPMGVPLIMPGRVRLPVKFATFLMVICFGVFSFSSFSLDQGGLRAEFFWYIKAHRSV